MVACGPLSTETDALRGDTWAVTEKKKGCIIIARRVSERTSSPTHHLYYPGLRERGTRTETKRNNLEKGEHFSQLAYTEIALLSFAFYSECGPRHPFFPGTLHYPPRVASSSSSGVRAGAWNPREGNTPSVVSTLYPSNEGSLPPPWRGAVTFDDCGCSECSTIVSPFQGTRRTAHATRVTKGLESSEYQAELFFQAQHFTAKHEKRAEKWTPWRRKKPKARNAGLSHIRISYLVLFYVGSW